MNRFCTDRIIPQTAQLAGRRPIATCVLILTLPV